MEITIIIGIVTIIWIWIVFQLYYAPEYDENEMPIVKSKRIKHRFHIDVDEDDINQDLGYKNSIHAVSRKRDDKEDVK